MPRRKGASTRKKTNGKNGKPASPEDDWITIKYSTVIYYVFIGLIIGLSIGALLLLWVANV